jgi:hypothetical protein
MSGGIGSPALFSLNNLNRALITAFGALQTTGAGSSIFNDNFDGTVIDVVRRWNAPILVGTGALTQISSAAGSYLLAATGGTAASAAASIQSIENFAPIGQGFVGAGALLTMNSAATLNTNLFMGMGTPGASFAAATPVTDGFGFEYDITGVFGASIYSAGTRVFRQALPTPAVGIPSLYAAYYRQDQVLFYINSTEEPVITVQILGPSISNLPFRFALINHTSVPTVSAAWQCNAVAVIDSTGTYNVQFDGLAMTRQRSPSVFKQLNALSVAAEATIWTPTTGRKFRIMGYVLTALGAAGNVVLKDNTAGTTILTLPFGAIGATLIVTPPAMANGILSATVNNVLTATGAASQTLSGYLIGCEE